MGCERYREAISARLDGEDEGVAADALDRHLTGCADCRTWLDAAATVTRLARTAPVAEEPAPVPDDAAPGPARGRITIGLRVALATVGFAQFLLGAAQIAGVGEDAHLHADAVGAGHLWNESAAWNLALGAGFAFVAFRRTRPAGLVPMLTAFVAVLVLLSAGDILAGEVGAGRLASHALLLVGYVITVALSRPTLDPGEPPAGGGRRWRVSFAPAEPPALRLVRGDGPVPGHARVGRSVGTAVSRTVGGSVARSEAA